MSKNIIGIYAIKGPNATYIGQSINITKRIKNHFADLEKCIHRCEHLQRAYNKYGKDAFSVKHLYIMSDYDKAEITKQEQYFIDVAKSSGIVYNTAPAAGSNVGVKYSAEARAKMSAWQLGRTMSNEAKAKMSAFQTGRKHSAETRAKMSAARKGKRRSAEARANISAGLTGKKLSEETKEKLAAANRGKTHSAEARAKMSVSQRRAHARKLSLPRVSNGNQGAV